MNYIMGYIFVNQGSIFTIDLRRNFGYNNNNNNETNDTNVWSNTYIKNICRNSYRDLLSDSYDVLSDIAVIAGLSAVYAITIDSIERLVLTQ